MSGQSDPDLCGVRWCGELRDHDGPHRGVLLDAFAMNVESGKPVILQALIQGERARTKTVVLITGECETGLTWPQVSDDRSAGYGGAAMVAVTIGKGLSALSASHHVQLSSRCSFEGGS